MEALKSIPNTGKPPLKRSVVQGTLSGKQKKWVERNGGVVSRSPDNTIKEVDRFIKDAECIKELLMEAI